MNQFQDTGAEHVMLEDKNGLTVLGGPGLHVPATDLGEAGPGGSEPRGTKTNSSQILQKDYS